MNLDEYAAVRAHLDGERPKPVTNSANFEGPDRTLVYGTHISAASGAKDTIHVYLKDGLIHRLVTSYPHEDVHDIEAYESRTYWATEDLIPSKRAFPHRTDFAFAERVVTQGVPIWFGNFEPSAPARAPFESKIREDFPE